MSETLAAPVSPVAPRPLSLWEKMFLYFYFFSIVGHFLELIFAPINHYLFGLPMFVPKMITAEPLGIPYGLGAVFVILVVTPLIRKYRLHLVIVFLLCVLLVAITEYLSGITIVAILGSNPFWNYSQRPFNLQGQICLRNSLLFGLEATLVVYYVYPTCEKIMAKFARQFRVATWILVIIFALDLTYSLLKFLL